MLGTAGGFEFAYSGAGGLAGVLGGTNQLAVPQGYLSGTAIVNSSIFAGQTFASLGLTPGTVTVRFNLGANADSFIFQIMNATSAVPEPASWAMLILGLGAVGYALRRRQSVWVSYAA